MSNGMQGTDSRYQVREGDTLATVAASVWGDASLWYMIAEANGLSGSEPLAAGTSLIVPAKVTNIHNSAGTFEVYDPNRALGDLSPTAAKPPKKAKCGMFGAILLVVIAVAVTALTAGAAVAALTPGLSLLGGMSAFAAGTAGFGTMVAAGAIGGVMGSIASQGFGVATGIQDKFSWKAVAMAGIGGAVSGGLSGAGAFARAGGTFVRGALTGATANALTQGIGVALGLQKKFNFAGVAAAGLASGVGGGVGKAMGTGALSDMSAYNIFANLTTSAASSIADAAARSLLEGTDFGDNLKAALPNIIGSTLGNMLAYGIAGAVERAPGQAPAAEPEPEVYYTEGDGFVGGFEESDSGLPAGVYFGGSRTDWAEGELHPAHLVYWGDDEPFGNNLLGNPFAESADFLLAQATTGTANAGQASLRAEIDREWATLTSDEQTAFRLRRSVEIQRVLTQRAMGIATAPYDEHQAIHEYLYQQERLPGQVTAAELRAFMPHATLANAQRYARPLSDAMARHGIITVGQRAGFLAQVAVETGELRLLTEDLSDRSVASIRRHFPRRTRGVPDAQLAPLVRNPTGLANFAYGGRRDLGNTQPGDGARYRGRGFLQVTGRANYRARGYENNPTALADPEIGAYASAGWWQSNGLNGRTTGAVNYQQFRSVVRTVNGGYNHLAERWGYYQQALTALRNRP